MIGAEVNDLGRNPIWTREQCHTSGGADVNNVPTPANIHVIQTPVSGSMYISYVRSRYFTAGLVQTMSLLLWRSGIRTLMRMIC